MERRTGWRLAGVLGLVVVGVTAGGIAIRTGSAGTGGAGDRARVTAERRSPGTTSTLRAGTPTTTVGSDTELGSSGSTPEASQSPAGAASAGGVVRASSTDGAGVSAAPTAPGGRSYLVNCPNGTQPVLDHAPAEAELLAVCGLGGTGGGSTHYALRCPDGTQRTLDHPADLAAMRALCGIADPPPPPPTAPPAPRLVGGSWTYADGSPFAWCTVPPDDSWRQTFPNGGWCPPLVPRPFRWTARYDDGTVLSGMTPVLDPGQSWRVTPNGWNGTLSISYGTDGSVSAGWGSD